ncbi:MAG: hypothetical protein ACO39F_07610 [Candidatus Nanopelagicaceae bacterium]
MSLAFYFAMNELNEHDVSVGDEVNLKNIVNITFKELGGAEEFGKQLGEKFKQIMNEDLSGQGAKYKEGIQKLRLHWAKYLTSMVQEKDRLEVDAGVTNLPPEEQKAILAPLVMEWLKNDDKIGRMVIENLKREDPDYFYTMITEEAQKLIEVDGSESDSD